MRGPTFETGGAAPSDAPLRKKILQTKRVCYPICVCVKCQLSISDSFQDMRGSQTSTRGRCTPQTPPCEKIFTPEKSMDKRQDNERSRTQALIHPSIQDMRGSQTYTRGRCTPQTPPCEKIFTPEKSMDLSLIHI